MKYVVAQWDLNGTPTFLNVYPFPQDRPEYTVEWGGIRMAWKFDSFEEALRFQPMASTEGYTSGVLTECEAKARWDLYEELCPKCHLWYYRGEHGHLELR